MNQKLDELDSLLDEAKKDVKYLRTDFLTGNMENIHDSRMKLERTIGAINKLADEITDEFSQ